MKFLDALGIRHETAHTRLLGWLLDPQEDHGFGPAILRRLLQHLALTPPVHLGEARNAVVSIEDGLPESRIDVLVRLPSVWLYIENKIAKGALKLEQLHLHGKGIVEHAKRHRRHLIILCPVDPKTGEPAAWNKVSKRYDVLHWNEFLDVLRRSATDLRKLRPRPAGLSFFEAYIDLVERRVLRRWKGMNLQVLSRQSLRSVVRYLQAKEAFQAELQEYLDAVRRELGKLPKNVSRPREPPFFDDGEAALCNLALRINRKGRGCAEVWLYFYCDADAAKPEDIKLWVGFDPYVSLFDQLHSRGMLRPDKYRKVFGKQARLIDYWSAPDPWFAFGENIPRRFWLNPRDHDVAIQYAADRLRQYLDAAVDLAK